MVAQQSKACTAFVGSEAGIMGSNPTQDIDIWYVCVYSVVVLSYV
jgi:hypothetical protein